MSKLLQVTILIAAILTVATKASAQVKNCEELKSEIAAKLDAKGVRNYTLEIVAADSVGEQRVVGSCEGGTKRIVYKRQ